MLTILTLQSTIYWYDDDALNPSGLDPLVLTWPSLKYGTETRIEILEASYNFKLCDLFSHKLVQDGHWNINFFTLLSGRWLGSVQAALNMHCLDGLSCSITMGFNDEYCTMRRVLFMFSCYFFFFNNSVWLFLQCVDEIKCCLRCLLSSRLWDLHFSLLRGKGN